MNPIKSQWRQLNAHEIAGRMFDCEYDLAMTVIEGMDSRGQAGDYTLERFRVNCA
jgi:putative transposase